ncbi:hypothetical protein KC573_04080 [candidate division WWE3 bacterium]|uniref:DOT1 domain-containing protein n=1 Tax=candidate division WWE3 bacterium TaxID=2053526 RepID=A0A955LWT2_UNCKA|nr:hypothetical protein [candidate division WWE3 bacterium]
MLIMLAISLWLLIASVGFIQTKKAGAYYVPTKNTVLMNIFEKLQPTKDSVLIDLGSGDGKILRFAAKEYGVTAIGYEVVLWPYLEYKIKNWFFLLQYPELRTKIKTIRESAFTADISQANYVFLYTSPEFSEKIAPKLKKELTPGTRIVSLTFHLPNWTALEEYQCDGMTYWIYET